jgi:hypothetical protein
MPPLSTISAHAPRAAWSSVQLGETGLFFSYGKLYACDHAGRLVTNAGAEYQKYRNRQLALWRPASKAEPLPQTEFNTFVASALHTATSVITQELEAHARAA